MQVSGARYGIAMSGSCIASATNECNRISRANEIFRVGRKTLGSFMLPHRHSGFRAKMYALRSLLLYYRGPKVYSESNEWKTCPS
jgi:hypothetical protein